MTAPSAIHDVAHVAAALGVHVVTVRGWIRAGRLRAHRLGAKHSRLRIRDVDLRALLVDSRRGGLGRVYSSFDVASTP